MVHLDGKKGWPCRRVEFLLISIHFVVNEGQKCSNVQPILSASVGQRYNAGHTKYDNDNS